MNHTTPPSPMQPMQPVQPVPSLPSDVTPGEGWLASLSAELPRAEADAGLRESVLARSILQSSLSSLQSVPMGAATAAGSRSSEGASEGAWRWAAAAMVAVGIGVASLLSSAGGPAQSTGGIDASGLAANAEPARPRLRLIEDSGLTLFHSHDTLTGLGVDPDDLLAIGDR